MNIEEIRKNAPEGATHYYIDCGHYMMKDNEAKWWSWDERKNKWVVVINFIYFGATSHLIKPL